MKQRRDLGLYVLLAKLFLHVEHLLKSLVVAKIIFLYRKWHIGLVGKISVSDYADRRFQSKMHQYVVSLSKTLCRIVTVDSTEK